MRAGARRPPAKSAAALTPVKRRKSRRLIFCELIFFLLVYRMILKKETHFKEQIITFMLQKDSIFLLWEAGAASQSKPLYFLPLKLSP
jgi:hypothetical protein